MDRIGSASGSLGYLTRPTRIGQPWWMPHSGGQLAIVWAGRQGTNTATFGIDLQAWVEGKIIPVTVSHDAFTNHGVEACKRIAEQKIIEALSKEGQSPTVLM